MSPRISTRTLVLAGLAISLTLAAVVSFWAAGTPDGLERVAESLGFADSAGDHAAADSPFADYGTKGVGDGFLSGGLAGVVGVLLTGAVMWLLLRLLARRTKD
ncbi:PDGLE domain-containing protein [Janibacter sp. GS2]|uniref:PDGLE domain-containing protein n=1 Tax=Janibacter sp. GS2 TaxID=3442646 RepID=UPI003EB94917